MYLQTSKQLNPVAEWGCLFCSLCKIAEEASGQEMGPAEILRVWSKNYVEGEIDPESTILSHQGVLDDLPGNLEYVGSFGPGREPGPGEYVIVLWYADDTGFKHFTVGDPKKGGWDPLGVSHTASTGRPIGTRVYRKKGV